MPPNNNRPRRNMNKLVAGGLGALMGGMALVGCAPNTPPAEAQRTDQVPPTPDRTPSPTATPEVAKDVPKKINVPSESPIFQALSEEMQKSYRSMDYMELEEFKRLPREQQLQYTDLTYRMVEDYVNEVLSAVNPNQFTPEMATLKASLDNTDDEIIKLHDKRRAAALVMMTQDGNLDRLDPNWKWRAKNYLVGLYSSPQNPALLDAIDKIDAAESLTGDLYSGQLLAGYRSNEVVKDGKATIRQVVFDSSYYDAEKRSNTFTYEEFTPLDAKDGETSHQWSSGSVVNA